MGNGAAREGRWLSYVNGALYDIAATRHLCDLPDTCPENLTTQVLSGAPAPSPAPS